MDTLTELFSTAAAQRVGWALIHFLWQGAAVALLLAVALGLLRNRSAQARWVLSCAALALMAVLPVATGLMVSVESPGRQGLAPAAGTADGIPAPPSKLADPAVGSVSFPPPGLARDPGAVRATPPAVQPAAVSWPRQLRGAIQPTLPWAILAWLSGVTLMSVWHLGGWLAVRRMKRLGTRPVAPAILEVLARLLPRLRIRRPVRLLESVRVAVPLVLGWLRPVILLPVGALTGLTPQQLEAILAHELAHIRRWDSLVLALQAVMETLLFYHPAVWWVSRRIRQESEQCCDDLAVGICGDRRGYAHALAKVAEFGSRGPALAAGATGGKLLPRIRRLLGAGRPAPACKKSIAWLVGGMALLVPVILWLAWLSSLGGEGAILAQARKLQEKARSSVRGFHPDGMGRLRLITSKGQVEAQTGLQPFLVFGNPIKVADLLTLLRARAESNRTGQQGPMSGEVSDLCYVCLDTLSFADDPDSVPVIAQLLTDTDSTIRGWAAIALYRLGNRGEELRKDIEKIAFPKSAIDSAAARGEKLPAWANRRQDASPSGEVRVSAPQPAAQETTGWGEPEGGITVRLRPARTTWKVSETPTLKCDLRSEGKFSQSWNLQQIEVDGAWYCLLDHPERVTVIAPGQTISDIPVTLNRRLRHAELEALLSLRHGMHIVRARLDIGPVPDAKSRVVMGPTWQVDTSPVRITVQAEGKEAPDEGLFTGDDIAKRVMDKAPADAMLDFDVVPASTAAGQWCQGLDLKVHGWAGRGAARLEPRPGSAARILKLASDEIVDAFREAHRRRQELQADGARPIPAEPGKFFAVLTDGIPAAQPQPGQTPLHPNPRLIVLRVDRYEVYEGRQHILYRWWSQKEGHGPATQPAPAAMAMIIAAQSETERKRREEEAAMRLAAEKAEDEHYRAVFEKYKAQILNAVKAGNTDEVAKVTDKFNESLAGKLLYMRVTRIDDYVRVAASDAPGKTTTLINKPFGDRRIVLPNIHHAFSPKPHVTRQTDDGRTYILIETNRLEGGKYADDVFITMAIDTRDAGAWPKGPPAVLSAALLTGGGELRGHLTQSMAADGSRWQQMAADGSTVPDTHKCLSLLSLNAN